MGLTLERERERSHEERHLHISVLTLRIFELTIGHVTGPGARGLHAFEQDLTNGRGDTTVMILLLSALEIYFMPNVSS